MHFKELKNTYNSDLKENNISVIVRKEDVISLLKSFYETLVSVLKFEQTNVDDIKKWSIIDNAATQKIGLDNYNEMRRDFVVNKVVAEVLTELELTPALTPQIRALAYPNINEDFSFKLVVVEKPKLTLSSYEPVEIETTDVVLTESLLNDRISELLEKDAKYLETDPHPVSANDCIKVDIATMCNGKNVPHLTGKNVILDLSDESMPSAFIAELLKMSPGETKSFSYEVASLRAISKNDVDIYSTTVNILSQLKKEVPKLTDAWVSESIRTVNTVESFKKRLSKSIEIELAAFNRDTHARLANNALAKRLEGEIPDAFFRAANVGIMQKLEKDLASEGKTIEDYYAQERMNEEEMSVQNFVRAAENLRQGFALETLFDGRGMELSQNDMSMCAKEIFDDDNFSESQYKKQGKLPLVESAAKRMVALNWLVDTAKVKNV